MAARAGSQETQHERFESDQTATASQPSVARTATVGQRPCPASMVALDSKDQAQHVVPGSEALSHACAGNSPLTMHSGRKQIKRICRSSH